MQRCRIFDSLLFSAVMKKYFYLLLLIAGFQGKALSNTIYVDATATGANDGSSWGNSIVLDGLTIRNGAADINMVNTFNGQTLKRSYGGGIAMVNVSVKTSIRYCHIEGNRLESMVHGNMTTSRRFVKL